MNNDLSEQENKELLEIAGAKNMSPEVKVRLMKRLLKENGHSEAEVGHGRDKPKQQNPPAGLRKTFKKYQWILWLGVAGFFIYLAFTNLVMFLSIVIFVGIVGGYGYYEIKRNKRRKEEKAKK